MRKHVKLDQKRRYDFYMKEAKVFDGEIRKGLRLV